MEKIPGLRAIGNASQENKLNEKERLNERLYNHNDFLTEQEKNLLEKYERQKTEEEIKLIGIINHEINELREDLGLEKFEIPVDNYHIFDKDFYERSFGENSAGQTHLQKQGIVLNEDDVRNSLISFVGTILHESLHLNGHTTLEVNQNEDGETKTTHYRQGISAVAAQKKGLNDEFHSHFDGVHEAIVAEQEKRSLKKLLNNPLLHKEKESLFSEKVENLKNEIVKTTPNVKKEDIIWVSENGEIFQSISYEKNRKVLNFVCDKIFEKFPERFDSQDEVFKLFLKAQFTGELLDIARLTEGTFGEGSFRRLGDMEETSKSAVKTYEALRKTLQK